MSDYQNLSDAEFNRLLIAHGVEPMPEKIVAKSTNGAAKVVQLRPAQQPAAEAVQRIIDGTNAKPKPVQFTSVWADEIPDTNVEWLVKDVLPAADVTFIYGESGSGKSFLTLDMAGSLSRGEKWNGRAVKQCVVTYVAAEGAAGFPRRLKAYRTNRGAIGKPTFGVISAAPNFTRPEDVDAIIAVVKANGGERRVVVIDTLSSVAPGADENSAKDMSLILSQCKRIRAETGATVVLIAHAGKDPSKGIRGWSGLKAAADASILVTRNGDVRSWCGDKLRDAEDGQEFGFRLERVVLGIDEDGDQITSCVVEHTGESDRGAALSSKALALLETVRELLRDKEHVSPAALKDAARDVAIEGDTNFSRNFSAALGELLKHGKIARDSRGISLRVKETPAEDFEASA